jgi:hypothetical protein
MPTQGPAETPLTRTKIADLIEQHGDQVLMTVVAALRGDRDKSDAAAARTSRATAASDRVTWEQVDTIEGFDHPWPEVHEHYSAMPVWEGTDAQGTVRFAIGKPNERVPVYGRERGWVSVWEVVNGQPREQRAVFVETDDFESTGDHIAVISGKGGSKKKGFAPHERAALPAVYDRLRVEVHRDRCNGPYAKNRLAVVAKAEEPTVMLDHALHHLRLRA